MLGKSTTGGQSLQPNVVIRDCGPRDGLQGERPLAPSQRAELATLLARAGLPEVEAVSFVSPRAVPAMAQPAAVAAALSPSLCDWWALVPNRRGTELALAAGFERLTVTVSASPTYSAKNVGMSVDESIAEVSLIRSVAPNALLDAVISCAFGSTFDEPLTRSGVEAVVRAVRDIGVDRITLADTEGVATPRRIRKVLDQTGTDVGLHLHDTRGTALANALAAHQYGIRRFDTSIGGLGGSPFAPTAGGNLATEDLVLMLEDLGIATGVALDQLLDASRLAAALVDRPLPSRVAASGALPAWA